ncbi:hypothetical protein ACWGID_39825 [Kribbella sp. NPDC054772]
MHRAVSVSDGQHLRRPRLENPDQVGQTARYPVSDHDTVADITGIQG